VDGAGPGGGELQIALAAHQIGLESGAERIAFPAHAVDLGAGLALKGVVDGRDERRGRGQVRMNLHCDMPEQQGGIDALPGIQAVIGAPIQMGATAQADEVGDGPAAGRHEPREALACVGAQSCPFD